MNERAPLPETLDAPPRGRVLLIVPHADDDVIGAGGTACLHARQGDPVRVVVAFDGTKGDSAGRHDPSAYRARRQAEARAGGALLGLSDYEFWDYPEGHQPTGEQLLEAADRVARCVLAFEPDLVYTPWIGEHHLDHHALARVVRLGLVLAEFSGEAWGFEVWTPLVPTRIVDVTTVHELKVRALDEHRSQLEEHDLHHKALGMSAHRAMYLGEEARQGEGFAPLGEPSPEDRRLLP